MDGPSLMTRNATDRIALRGVHVHARLAGLAQRTTVAQTFVNLEAQPIEALYTFPLPEGAAVCAFEVITGERVLTGTVDEAEAAQERYEAAIEAGHGAFVAEQNRPDIFTVRVGNLLPRQAATIRLSYVAPLAVMDRQIRLAIPTTVAPRYVTASGTNADPLEIMADGDAVNPPHALHVPFGMAIEVDVALGRGVRLITSPSHTIEVEPRGDGGTDQRVTLAAGLTEMNRDFVLNVALAKDVRPQVQAVRHGRDDEAFVAVTFIPEFERNLAEAPATETLFVLDCSGSMMGESLAQAVAALELCLRSLSVGDTFNVCRFGSTYELLATVPLAYSEASLRKALAYVRGSHDLGGTELHGPLQALLAEAPRVGAQRQVILLTDGQVSNEAAVLALARQHRKANRIFAFGIGSSCSASLVNGLARATGGAAEFITTGERIDDKVLRTFGRIASPAVADAHLDWHGAEVQTLAELPPVFDGEVLTVFARVLGRAPAQVTLKCVTPLGAQTWALAVPPPARDDVSPIPLLWARRAIQSLEEVNNVTNLVPAERKASRDCQAIIELSKRFNLLSALTTFVAIEHRSLADRTNGMPALRRVPNLLAKGWGGVEFEGAMAAGGAPCAAPCVAMPSPMQSSAHDVDADMAEMYRSVAPASARRSRGPGVFKKLAEMFGGGAAAGGKLDAAKSASAPPPQTAPREMLDDAFSLYDRAEMAARPEAGDEMQTFLALQSAEGAFGWDPLATGALANLGVSEALLRAVLDAVLWPEATADRAALVTTLLVLHVLRTCLADREPLWRRAGAKAVRYVAKATGKTAVDVEALLVALPPAVA